MLLAFMGYGLATVGAVLVGRQWPAMGLLAAAGFSLTTAFSTLNSLVQEHAPNALRGRVLSIFGLAFRGGMPVGSLAAGALVKGFGAPAVMGTFAGVPRKAVLAAMTQQGRLEVKFTLEGRLDDPSFSLNENFATRVASGMAESLGVSLSGMVKGLGGVVKGLFGR